MFTRSVCFALWLFALLLVGNNAATSHTTRPSIPKRESLQDVVTFDKHSVMIRGERLMIFAGEFHPFRLPVLGLWLDIFQKIKAMGFNGVSFYVDWGLVEGEEGNVRLDGVFSLDEFFRAATEAGIYLIARPGPYINAEVAAGGFPGWTLRINCTLRSTCPEYLEATGRYMEVVGKAIADAQITNGGPVILVQPENEYVSWPGLTSGLEQYQNHTFPDAMNKQYMADVEGQLRAAGIVVPLIFNDNYIMGNFAPGSGVGAVDLYAIDAYPLRYDCAHPTVWPTDRFPRDWNTVHDIESPSTPFAIAEYQGGSGTPFGGVNQDSCNALVNQEAVRVLYKNNYSFGLKLFSIYMTYGGTNWGNLGYMGGDTSYDYGAAITEDRHVWREKYSEEKLQANFFKVSPAWLTAVRGNATNGAFAGEDVTVTPIWGSPTNFYVVRQANFSSMANITYEFSVATSRGNVTLPQLGGQLSLNGRDSKFHVTDYDVGGINLTYSTAEIFTWAKSAQGSRVLVLYGGAGELHELALPKEYGKPVLLEGPDVLTESVGASWVVQWKVTSARTVLSIDGKSLRIHLLWRNDAYNHWTLELPASQPLGNFSLPSKDFVILKAGYLMRTASILNGTLKLTGDINATTGFELLHEPTGSVRSIEFNGHLLNTSRSHLDTLIATIPFTTPEIPSIDLLAQPWHSINSLPEIQTSYDDSLWTPCNHTTSTNNQRNLTTPYSLYASDYGYHAGSLLYRAHFTTPSTPSNSTTTLTPPTLFLNISAGYAFAHSVFLNSTFLASFTGTSGPQIYAQNISLPALIPGTHYVLTVVIDHMGQTEEGPGSDVIKYPMGILDYSFTGGGYTPRDLVWKLTGNLGGESYHDLTRGPRNEGGMFAERHGYHLPSPPVNNSDWSTSTPGAGLSSPGITFYTTTMDLDIPTGYDVPMSFVFNDGVIDKNASSGAYRVQLFVNGFQYGKFVSNLGPQTAFPVPEGVLDHKGRNWVGITLWALEGGGPRVRGLRLVPEMPVWSGYRRPEVNGGMRWTRREGAY